MARARGRDARARLQGQWHRHTARGLFLLLVGPGQVHVEPGGAADEERLKQGEGADEDRYLEPEWLGEHLYEVIGGGVQ